MFKIRRILLFLFVTIFIFSYDIFSLSESLPKMVTSSEQNNPLPIPSPSYFRKPYVIAGVCSLALVLSQKIGPHFFAFMKKNHTQVAVLKISGMISDSAHYTCQLKSFFENPQIKAIVLKINSGGGHAGSGKAIFDEIQLLKKQYPKPIITISENILASAAYYIAAATDYIIAPSSVVTGSIGVISMGVQIKELLEYLKIRPQIYSAGKYKSTLNSFTSITPEQEKLVESLQSDIYEQFAKDVATSRKLDLAKIDEWADGKIFTGNQALKLGLIDEVGSWSNVEMKLKKMIEIKGRIEWVYPPKITPWMRLLSSKHIDEEPKSDSFYTNLAQALITTIENRYLAPMTMYA